MQRTDVKRNACCVKKSALNGYQGRWLGISVQDPRQVSFCYWRGREQGVGTKFVTFLDKGGGGSFPTPPPSNSVTENRSNKSPRLKRGNAINEESLRTQSFNSTGVGFENEENYGGSSWSRRRGIWYIIHYTTTLLSSSLKWLTCNFFLWYPYIIQQTGNANTQTYKEEAIILI